MEEGHWLLSVMRAMAWPCDWPEDYTGENGTYSCMCAECKTQFFGHKRRVVCKVCAERKVKEV